MSAREVILARVRGARGDTPLVEPTREYRMVGELAAGSSSVLDLLEDRLVDYRATVTRCVPEDLADAVGAALAAAGATSVLLPPDLPREWAPNGRPDDGALSAADLDAFSAVVTGCRIACADTGTIALDGAGDQGRRAITLVPDVHVCVVRADQVVHTVPELLAGLDPTRPITLISGPSATSDIELERVEGVHGPRVLSVVLVEMRAGFTSGHDSSTGLGYVSSAYPVG